MLPIIYSCFRSLVHFELDTCKTKAMDIIHKLLSHESVPLYTQNDLDLATEKSKWLSNYTYVHQNPGKYYIYPKLPSLTSTSPPRPVVPPHTYNDELSVMATVSAYFQVAAKVSLDHRSLSLTEFI